MSGGSIYGEYFGECLTSEIDTAPFGPPGRGTGGVSLRRGGGGREHGLEQSACANRHVCDVASVTTVT